MQIQIQHVWCRPGQSYHSSTMQAVKYGGGSVPMWDCMNAKRTGEVTFIEQKVCIPIIFDALGSIVLVKNVFVQINLLLLLYIWLKSNKN